MDTSLPLLVIDDVSSMREIIVRQLRTLGFTRVSSTGNGREALRLLESEPFKMVIADWHMPGMDGIELLHHVRANPRLRHIAYILMTAEAPRGGFEDAVMAGVDAILLKPFTPAILEERISVALAGQRRPPAATGARVLTNMEEDEALPQAVLRTVLVVDDNPTNLTLASSVLRHDYQVKLATSAQKAMALCEHAVPDLILLDIMMPDTDGFQACRQLKQNPLTAHVPVIFLTALEDTDHIVQGLQQGAVDYIAKPLEPLVLKARVEAALRIAAMQDDLRQRIDLMVENIRLREDIENMARHDVKNPVAAAQAMARTMLRETEQGAEGQRMLRFIDGATGDALRMLQASGDIALMEQGRYQLAAEPVNLAALARRVADEVRHAFAGKDLRVHLEVAPADDDPPMVDGEEILLYSMLHNLARNAAEAVENGGAIRIGIEVLDKGGWRLVVRNPGTVEPRLQRVFFDKYASGRKGGLGLGTYSARLIAETHGARIALRSSDELGTEVSVRFGAEAVVPLAPTQEDGVENRETAEPAHSPQPDDNGGETTEDARRNGWGRSEAAAAPAAPPRPANPWRR